LKALLLAPHADDESLFAFYTMMREDADVLLMLDSGEKRREEFAAAMEVSGRMGDRWIWNSVPEDNPDWLAVGELTLLLAVDYDLLIAPAWEEGGHEHHNEVARLADRLNTLIHIPSIRYLTYKRGHGRTVGVEVVADPAERDLKLAALQCYQSQWENPATAPWFPGGEYGTYQEWIEWA